MQALGQSVLLATEWRLERLRTQALQQQPLRPGMQGWLRAAMNNATIRPS